MDKNPYQVLGVSENATEDEIRQAYRTLAHHVSIAGAVALEATHPLFDALLNVVGLFLRNDHNAVHPAVHFGFAPNGYRVFTHIVCPFLHIRIDADVISN